MEELHRITMHELQELLRSGKISSKEVTEFSINRIKRLDSRLNAFLYVNEEGALKKAIEVDKKRVKKEPLPPLAGIPMALKDILITEDIPTTCASKILEGYKPPYSGTAVQRLIDQEIVMIGKTNMDEFAMGSSNENSAFGTVKNPWDLEYIPGGSSGGSAAAVSSGEVFGALGTDTGGSIRQPAALTGIVGLKPTYGRVSRYGVVAFASSLDQVGPMTRDVHDCALMLNVISGFDPKDTTSAQIPVPDYTRSLAVSLNGMKIGVAEEYFGDGLDKEVAKGVQDGIQELNKLGAEIVSISLPHLKYSIPTYYIICTAEASSNLARYDGVRYGYRAKGIKSLMELYKKSRGDGFGAEVKRRIMLGTFALCSGYYDAYFKKAAQVRTLIIEDFKSAFEKVDVIITPTTPTPAFKIGEKTEDPLQMYLSDIYTISVNLAGLPGISIPCGFFNNRLPIGMQLIADHMQEEKLIKTGHAYQAATDFHKRHPELESR